MPPDDGESHVPPLEKEGDEMAVDTNFSEFYSGVLLQSGMVAQNNFIGFQKALDYDYLEGKRLVSMEEAMGVREVSSQTTPGGPKPAGG